MRIPALLCRTWIVFFLGIASFSAYPAFVQAAEGAFAGAPAAGPAGVPAGVPAEKGTLPAAALAPGGLDASAGQAIIERFKAGGGLYLLDVRTPEEFKAGHIPGAVNIPLGDLEVRLGEIPADKALLIVCRTGRRAASAYEVIHKARPAARELWFLRATPEYGPDGRYRFR